MLEQNPIVTFRQLDQAFNKGPRGHESVMKIAQEQADAVANDPVESAMMLASLGNALKILEDSEQVPGVLVSPDHRMASLLQSFLASEATSFEPLKTGGEEAKFDEKDLLGWFVSLFSWIKGLRKHEWLVADPEPETIPRSTDDFRLALLGDWGTGLYGAPECSKSIAGDASGYDLLFHLGDVYYSGDIAEIENRFIKFWPKNDSTLKNALSRACNSNHEMYTGGNAYFDVTLKRFGQKASYFALQNDYWILAGLDSAYFTGDLMHNKADLNEGQLEWLNRIVNNAGERKVLLFTHHQPFSHFDSSNALMTGKLNDLLKDNRIFGWYWGHEHRCILYDQHPAWGFYGRCVGHSGFPYFRDKLNDVAIIEEVAENTRWFRLEGKNLTPAARILDGPNQYLKGEEDKYGLQGYMTLEFSGNQLNEIVHAPDGTILYNRRLV